MVEKVEIDTKNISVRDISDGYTTLFIKSKDTVENEATLISFREFCKIETDNHYTLGLRKLLEYYQGDYKTELIYDEMLELKTVIADLKASIIEINKPKEEEKSEDSDLF